MAVDLSQFYDVFFDEADEHLANLEAQILAINLAAPSVDAQNEIFRAAHSIKGGAATFGFKDMADLTHQAETLLDEVRKGHRPMTSALVDVILQAVDMLKNMANAHRAGQPLAADAGHDLTQKLILMVQQGNGTAPVEAANPTVSATHEAEPIRSYRVEANLAGTLDWHALLNRLGDFPQAQVRSFPLDTHSSEPLVIEVRGSSTDLNMVIDSLGFLISPENIRTQTMGQDPQSGKDDEAYGLFADECYGFFDEPPATATQPDGDESFGFFTPVAAVPTPAVPAKPEGEDYGFFGDVPPAPIEKPAAPSPAPAQAPVVAEVHPHAEPAASSHPAAREAKTAEATSIRVGVEKVDQLLNLVGELVITQSMLAQCCSLLDPAQYERLLAGVSQLERNTRELQESVMSIRMLPISAVFSRYPRLVRDIAGKLNKKVELKLIGENTELDKGFIEKLADPLTHLVRNSLDHGIESPEKRLAQGKPETGTLTLRAFHQGGNIIIEVRDDGGGLNRERILAKGRERGLPVSDTMTDQEVWALIFEPGFSTAATITDVSGRGVGMDVVRRNIQSMGGRIDIESMQGIGTTMILRLPLTLAILDGLSVAVGDEIFIVPLTFITESLQPRAEDVKSVAGHGRVIKVRGDYMPLVALHSTFNIVPRVSELHRGLCVLLEADGERVALFVDDLLGQHQVVIKNLESNYRKVAGISGATIMGDGRVALILDVPAIISLARHQNQQHSMEGATV